MDTEASILCPSCAQIFEKDYKVGVPEQYKKLHSRITRREPKKADTRQHHLSFVALEQSAKGGCHMCMLFLNQIPDDIRVAARKAQGRGFIIIDEVNIQLDVSHKYDIKLGYLAPHEMTTEHGIFIAKLHMRSNLGKTLEINICLIESHYTVLNVNQNWAQRFLPSL